MIYLYQYIKTFQSIYLQFIDTTKTNICDHHYVYNCNNNHNRSLIITMMMIIIFDNLCSLIYLYK